MSTRPIAPALCCNVRDSFDQYTAPASEPLKPIGIALCKTIVSASLDKEPATEIQIFSQFPVKPVETQVGIAVGSQRLK
jgi:hypothetical protein